MEKTNEQYYDEEAQTFLADRYIMGECPHCGNPDAYGDQCERCGKDLSPTELINPRSTRLGSQARIAAKLRTGICHSTSISNGSSRGLRVTRSGVPM